MTGVKGTPALLEADALTFHTPSPWLPFSREAISPASFRRFPCYATFLVGFALPTNGPLSVAGSMDSRFSRQPPRCRSIAIAASTVGELKENLIISGQVFGEGNVDADEERGNTQTNLLFTGSAS